jgi:hypothetical protein
MKDVDKERKDKLLRDRALWKLSEWERQEIEMEKETGLPAKVYEKDDRLKRGNIWLTDDARENRFLSILDDLEIYHKGTPLEGKELLRDDSLSQRLCDFLCHRLGLSPGWSAERLKLYAQDLSLLVKWNFQPTKEKDEDIIGKSLKKHWKELVDIHSLRLERREPVQLSREVSLLVFEREFQRLLTWSRMRRPFARSSRTTSTAGTEREITFSTF